MSNSFDQLKREAVNLERQLEDKIGRYQQVRGARGKAEEAMLMPYDRSWCDRVSHHVSPLSLSLFEACLVSSSLLKN